MCWYVGKLLDLRGIAILFKNILFCTWKRHSEKDVLEAEQQQQLKKIQAQILNVSNKQKAADQQREVYEQQGKFIEKLLDQLKQGKSTDASDRSTSFISMLEMFFH